MRIHSPLNKLVFLLFLFLIQLPVYAQREEPAYMFRAYEDDDYLNDLGIGTDHAYSSGEQLNLFYNLNHKPHFIERVLPRAGDSSVNTYSVGLMQVMYTPNYLGPSYYIPNDYSYAGASIFKHSLYSYNPKKKYDLQTEIVLGIMGPDALAKQAQEWLHTVIHDTVPSGWDNQYKNAPLVNINFTIEKELIHNLGFEAIGANQIFAGTMLDGEELSLTLYLGKMSPYFNGFMGHYSTSYDGPKRDLKKLQFYFIMKIAGQYILYSSVLQGGLFTPPPMVKTIVNVGGQSEIQYIPKPKQDIENFVAYAAYGPVVAYRHWSITYTQTYSSPVLKNVYSYVYGNVSVYYSW